MPSKLEPDREPTVLASRGDLASAAVVGEWFIDLKPGEKRSIGRWKENGWVFAHPQVSAHHAEVHATREGVFLRDLGSANGTFVSGTRVRAEPRRLEDGDRVQLGPVALVVRLAREPADTGKWSAPRFALEVSGVTVEVRARGGKKRIVDGVSFKALPGDFIALMGPSGAGKTTLLEVLTTYRRPDRGQVKINGDDLFEIYDALRGSVGYVPQDDILHSELTVREAVFYAARMRLPPDTTNEEIDERVHETLVALSLEQQADMLIGKPEKKVISGGQRKRVNIAIELVTDPPILFLDEPTSGLAADDTTQLIELLARLAKERGKTIISTIHQPAKDEYEQFNLALILGRGGIPMYFGPTRDSYGFFGAWSVREGNEPPDDPRDMFELLRRRALGRCKAGCTHGGANPCEASQLAVARAWHQEFYEKKHPVMQKMYAGARALGTAKQAGAMPRGVSTSGQLGILAGRYFRTKRRDVGGMLVMALQPLVIGGIIVGGMRQESLLPTAIFVETIAAVWFGTSNAAREIVGERALFRRERKVTLGLFNYVLSKLVVLVLLSAVQVVAMASIVQYGCKLTAPVWVTFAPLMLASTMGVTIGLLVSSLVRSSEAAIALTPLVLLPQVVFGGALIRREGKTQQIVDATPLRYAFHALLAAEDLRCGSLYVGEGDPRRETPQVYAASFRLGLGLAPKLPTISKPTTTIPKLPATKPTLPTQPKPIGAPPGPGGPTCLEFFKFDKFPPDATYCLGILSAIILAGGLLTIIAIRTRESLD
jgi:ABC-type multidrug transport system ATPase subunit